MDSGMTLKQLSEVTQAPFYIIKYLNALGRLPVVWKSNGPGYSTVYHRDAIQVVRRHLSRSNRDVNTQRE